MIYFKENKDRFPGVEIVDVFYASTNTEPGGAYPWLYR